MLRLPTGASANGPSRAVERDVSLDGDAAASWLRDRGWAPDGPERGLRLAADAVRSEDFAAARISHNASHLKRMPGPAGIAGTVLLEGTLEVLIGEESTTFSPEKASSSTRPSPPR
ncbi:hypothetical protein Q0F99_08105 [Rathayibacter oskolensis]|uniref:hypothetical protein n=1 Tax=Rathayibacter oskolensis TaxID=1891671 RepID=UPI0026600740|nr:hypothetical protein [Rathayibacter oskolensis]WKK72833.1 hypothetical protein Q0F99_08105 [Rathayibacter oskolensis]